MTVERENRWLKVFVVVMAVVGVLGVVGHHLTSKATVNVMDQQVRLWQLRCGQQQQAADQPALLAAALSDDW
jgi:hypothetical protein